MTGAATQPKILYIATDDYGYAEAALRMVTGRASQQSGR